MPDPSLTLEMAIKDGKVIAGLDAMAKQEDKVAAGAAKIGTEARKAEADLDRFAKRTTAINSTPLEKYHGHLAKLDTALKAGKITQETYNRSVERAGEALRGVSQESKKMAGADLIGSLKTMAAGWLSIEGAIRLAMAAVGEYEVKATTSKNRMMDLAQLRTEIGQVGGPELQKRAKALTKHGLTEKESLELTLNAQNLGFLDNLEFIAKNKAGLGDVKSLSEVAGLAPKMFNGAINTKQAMNMTFAAANPSRLTPGQMAPLIGRASMGAVQQGTSPDEAFAMMSVLADIMPSPEVGGHWLQTFQTKLSVSEDERLRGKGTMGAVKALVEMGPEDAKESFLKNDTETHALFQKLRDNQGLIAQRTKEVEAARLGTTDLVGQATQRNLSNPEIAAPLQLTASREQLAQQEEARYGPGSTKAERGRNALLGGMEKNRANQVAILGAKYGTQAAEYAGFTSPESVAAIGVGAATPFIPGGALGMGQAAQWTADAVKALQEQTELLKDIRDNGKGSSARGAQRDAMNQPN